MFLKLEFSVVCLGGLLGGWASKLLESSPGRVASRLDVLRGARQHFILALASASEYLPHSFPWWRPPFLTLWTTCVLQHMAIGPCISLSISSHSLERRSLWSPWAGQGLPWFSLLWWGPGGRTGHKHLLGTCFVDYFAVGKGSILNKADSLIQVHPIGYVKYYPILGTSSWSIHLSYSFRRNIVLILKQMHKCNQNWGGIYARIFKITVREKSWILYLGYTPLLLGYFGGIA